MMPLVLNRPMWTLKTWAVSCDAIWHLSPHQSLFLFSIQKKLFVIACLCAFAWVFKLRYSKCKLCLILTMSTFFLFRQWQQQFRHIRPLLIRIPGRYCICPLATSKVISLNTFHHKSFRENVYPRKWPRSASTRQRLRVVYGRLD